MNIVEQEKMTLFGLTKLLHEKLVDPGDDFVAVNFSLDGTVTIEKYCKYGAYAKPYFIDKDGITSDFTIVRYVDIDMNKFIEVIHGGYFRLIENGLCIANFS